MKKLALLLCVLMAVMCLCACNTTAEFDYSDEDNGELISMENHKISGDEIGLSVVSNEEQNKVKVYKTEFTADDFSAEIKDKKVSSFVYLTDEEKSPRYPAKVNLPQYDMQELKDIAVAKYIDKSGSLPASVAITAPQFSVKSFTGKLVITYTFYSSPALDEYSVKCFTKAERVTLTGDLYTYEVE